jgi:N-acetylglutamate synthase-like GNAT family acetyltransferase
MAEIRQAVREDAAKLAEMIRRAFRTPAERFGLTPEDCPRHSSNCTAEWVRDAMAEGVSYYLLEADGEPVGCVALEEADQEIGYLKRLAVLPEHRGRGLGGMLVERVFAEARRRGLRRVSIGLIAGEPELPEWYGRRGFRAVETRTYEHLPFEVLIMCAEL